MLKHAAQQSQSSCSRQHSAGQGSSCFHSDRFTNKLGCQRLSLRGKQSPNNQLSLSIIPHQVTFNTSNFLQQLVRGRKIKAHVPFCAADH